MTSDAVAIVALIILLFPMGYFFLASPAFLLVKLDIPPVALLLRGMFNAHFLAMSIAGVICTAAFVMAGRPVFATGVGELQLSRSGDAAGFSDRWMTSSAPGMQAMPTRPAGCADCIGAGCSATRSC